MGCKSNNWTCAWPLSNFKKKCVFFVVPVNGQALLGLPDTVALNIINLNIDSIQKEIRECKTNRGQEMHAETETAQTRVHRMQSNKMAMVNNTKQTN